MSGGSLPGGGGGTPLALAPAMKNTRLPRPPRKDLGTSLLEVTMAMAIMALSLVSMLSLLSFSVHNKEGQRELEMARQSAAAVHESLKGQTAGSAPVGQAFHDYLHTAYGPAKVQTIDGRPVEITTYPVSGLTWSRWTPSQGSASNLGRGTVTVDLANPQLIAVTVQIDWKSTGRNSRYSMRALYAAGYFK
jgi:Tfp pilus assembly protein PilV